MVDIEDELMHIVECKSVTRRCRSTFPVSKDSILIGNRLRCGHGSHIAGGVGCGQSLTRKACRKLIWWVRGRPLPNLAAELGSVDLVANLQEPARPAFACTSSSLAYAAQTWLILHVLKFRDLLILKFLRANLTLTIANSSENCKTTSCFKSASFENKNVYH